MAPHAGHDHGGMDMDMDMDMGSSMSGMDMGSTECSMHMLGNWQTLGTCVLTSSWRITTEAQFAGTCIGVFLIVFLIETIRRWGREFDRWILEQAAKDRASMPVQSGVTDQMDRIFFGMPRRLRTATRITPTTAQQAVRSLIYGIQFTGVVSIVSSLSASVDFDLTDTAGPVVVPGDADRHDVQRIHSTGNYAGRHAGPLFLYPRHSWIRWSCSSPGEVGRPGLDRGKGRRWQW